MTATIYKTSGGVSCCILSESRVGCRFSPHGCKRCIHHPCWRSGRSSSLLPDVTRLPHPLSRNDQSAHRNTCWHTRAASLLCVTSAMQKTWQESPSLYWHSLGIKKLCILAPPTRNVVAQQLPAPTLLPRGLSAPRNITRTQKWPDTC